MFAGKKASSREIFECTRRRFFPLAMRKARIRQRFLPSMRTWMESIKRFRKLLGDIFSWTRVSVCTHINMRLEEKKYKGPKMDLKWCDVDLEI